MVHAPLSVRDPRAAIEQSCAYSQMQSLGPSGDSPAVLMLQNSTVEMAADVLISLLEFAAPRTATQVDDLLLRHVRAVRNSPELVDLIRQDIELLLPGVSGPDSLERLQQLPGSASLLGGGGMGLIVRLLEALQKFGGNLDLTTLLQVISLITTIRNGTATLSQILEVLRQLMNRTEQLQAGSGG